MERGGSRAPQPPQERPPLRAALLSPFWRAPHPWLPSQRGRKPLDLAVLSLRWVRPLPAERWSSLRCPGGTRGPVLGRLHPRAIRSKVCSAAVLERAAVLGGGGGGGPDLLLVTGRGASAARLQDLGPLLGAVRGAAALPRLGVLGVRGCPSACPLFGSPGVKSTFGSHLQTPQSHTHLPPPLRPPVSHITADPPSP